MTREKRSRAARQRARRRRRARGDGPATDPALEGLLKTARECLDQDEPVQAEQVAREALRRSPEEAGASWLLGRALIEQGRDADALVPLRRAAAGLADRGAALEVLGQAEQRAGEGEAALATFRALVAERPRDPRALNDLGLAALEYGALAEAEKVLRAAFDLDPLTPGVCLNLARSHRFGPADDAMVSRMRELAERTGLVPELRADICFAVGKALDDRGEHGTAFRYLARANRVMRTVVEFDRERHREAIEWVIRTFDAELFHRCAGFGLASEQPVFIVGMPRSGTTLVEQVLAAHPAVHGGGELKCLDRVATRLARRLGSRMRYPRCAAELDEAAARASAGDYLEATESLAAGAARLTDKLPANFVHLGLAALILPGARVIHCLRDPMDLCLSIYQQQFAEGHGWAYDLDDIVAFFAEQARLMAHWRAVLPLPILEVRYERLVHEHEAAARELVDFCGLQWHPACLEFHRVERKVETASNWQVRQPLYSSSVGRWKRFEQELTPLRDALQAVGLLAQEPGSAALPD